MTLEARIPRVGKSRFSWLLRLSFASALVVCGCGDGGGGAPIPTPTSYTVGRTVSDLLIAEWRLPPSVGEELADVLMSRYEKLSTVVTSNRPIKDRAAVTRSADAPRSPSNGS
jgi:hypothetical protein